MEFEMIFYETPGNESLKQTLCLKVMNTNKTKY